MQVGKPNPIKELTIRLVGQAVKTPPSHGGNSGSIPLRAASGMPTNTEFVGVFYALKMWS